LLRDRAFDLIILSSDLSDQEKQQISTEAGGTPVLELHGFTAPEELLDTVKVFLRDFVTPLA
jgi:hypothetical protein